MDTEDVGRNSHFFRRGAGKRQEAVKYRERPRWGLSCDECRYIYSICQMFSRQDTAIQRQIKAVLDEVSARGTASESDAVRRRQALWRCLSTKDEQVRVAADFFMDQSTLSRLVREFYRGYALRYLR